VRVVFAIAASNCFQSDAGITPLRPRTQTPRVNGKKAWILLDNDAGPSRTAQSRYESAVDT
jgi:hypothetical protein